jgi:hypothetical protein
VIPRSLRGSSVGSDGNVEYWPNLGRGHWGKRLAMRQSPRYPLGYDPRRILLADVDGDGLADLVYVDYARVLLWINQSGNAWSAQPIVIEGTPPVTDPANIRLIDLHGTGVSGLLWTADATGFHRDRMMFLDFTGGRKPYLLQAMDNYLGAVTRVAYQPSTAYYLADQQKPETRWRTPLPFPVQVVARVESIDAISKTKLTTEYNYHHGYWDGAEREFRGFGMVEQTDSEALDTYEAGDLFGDAAFTRFRDARLEEYFSPPTLTKTWFHQGAVGEEYGDWEELDYTAEYWPVDPGLLDHVADVNAFLATYNDRPGTIPSPRNRRIKRDALRALRGRVLRTELYARDASARERSAYTVTEFAYGLAEVDAPDQGAEVRGRVFFSHEVARRTTQWERGNDPLTVFALSDDYDAFGQPTRQTSVAVPRRVDQRGSFSAAVIGTAQPDQTATLATRAMPRRRPAATSIPASPRSRHSS